MLLLKGIHQLLAFLLELAMLGAFGLWGFRTGRPPLTSWLLGIGLPLLVTVVWGIWLAPKAAIRVGLPQRAILILTLFELSAYLLYRSGFPKLALTFALLAVISTALTVVFPE